MKLLILFLGVISLSSADETILCSPSICKDVECPDLPEKCKAQNSTHSGIILPAATVCNCCKYCIEHLNEDEPCSIGEPSTPVPVSICGPGLYCKNSDTESNDGICTRINTKCTKKQHDYDTRRAKGTLGQMEIRQECDGEGNFVSYKCIPGQTCYCVDKEGNRIFGEADFTSIPEAELKCGCSRDHAKAVGIIGKELHPDQFFRCTASGDYDALQCISGMCMCVDAEDGAPTYPDEDSTNITQLAKSTVKCFNKIDIKAGFYKKCETEYLEVLKEYNQYKQQGVTHIVNFDFPKCDLDGTYQAVQENSTHKICVDKEGAPLSAVDKAEDKIAANSMNCKCVRALAVMSFKTDRPKCAVNGNYETVQCRRGTCRCVDENGNQMCNDENCEVDENETDKLKCPASWAVKY